MSNRMVLAVGACALCLVFAAADKPSSSGSPAEVTIRVTSMTPGHEVEVEGAYVYSPGGSEFHHVKEQTPFTLKEQASRLMGIFGTASAESPIHVEVVSQGTGSKPTVSTATGKAVTFTTVEAPGGGSSITGL